MRIFTSQRVPVAEGLTLATDVYLPDGSGRYPTVFSRTPYNRAGMDVQGAYFTGHGYAFVAQNVRGRAESDGVFEPLIHEESDGWASLDWIANQRWCDGRIAMWGASYGGMVQWYAALSGHEALRCIAPHVAPGSHMQEWPRHGGCFAWANAVRWLQTWTISHDPRPLDPAQWDALWQGRNLDAIRETCGILSPILERWLERDRDDAGWRQIDVRARVGELRVPVLHTAGWWDHISGLHFDLAARYDGSGPPHYLMVGPWGHGPASGGVTDAQLQYGDWHFTEAAQVDTIDRARRFIDRFLREDDTAFADEPMSRAFVMGENRWVMSTTWPMEGTSQQVLHLAGQGDAAAGEGQLQWDTPSCGGEMAYTYDPRNPCPSRGGPIYWGLAESYGCGPVDVRPLLARPDVAVFRSAPLAGPLRLLGSAQLQITVAADVEDTDLIARLAVEEPHDGGVRPLLVGSLQLRFRAGFADPQPLALHTPTRVTIPLGATGYRFPAGSRIVLMITSSDFPRLLPHSNRLADTPGGAAFAEPVKASIRLLCGGPEHSRLTLTVRPGD